MEDHDVRRNRSVSRSVQLFLLISPGINDTEIFLVKNQGLKHSYFVLFSDKIPIFPIFFPYFSGKFIFFLFFGHFAFNFSILYSFYYYFMRKHSLKIFSLALLGIKIFFSHIILQSPKVPPISHPCYNYKSVTNRQEGGGVVSLNKM